MSNSWQRVHFGVYTDDASAESSSRTGTAPGKFRAPGGGKAEVLPCHCETAQRHKLAQAIMCVSV
jgi:hypothetical protein